MLIQISKWQPTPVLLPRKFHGQRSLGGYSPWNRKESDTTEQLHSHTHSLTVIFVVIFVVNDSNHSWFKTENTYLKEFY